jgi:transcriptional regulator with XRE-family HTH domain
MVIFFGQRHEGGDQMTPGERVNAVRRSKKMTMEQFGEQIGVQKSAISKIEKDKVNLSEQTIKSICREFNVNEDWLRTGAGGPENMFIPEDMRYLNTVGRLGNEQNEFKKFCINMLMELPDKYWDYIYEEFKKFEKKEE